jgi:GntR family transcriptional repressor for pyruvate dehydrogenase complex
MKRPTGSRPSELQSKPTTRLSDPPTPYADSGRVPPQGRHDAVGAITAMIRKGELKPGDRLPPERELAIRFDLARSSIREAIRELAAVNVLVARRGAGTFVTGLESVNLFASLELAVHVDPKAYLHVIEARRILEPAVAASAAVRLSTSQLAELDELLTQYSEHASSMHMVAPDHERVRRETVLLDERIHEILAEAHGNPVIIGILSSLRQVARSARELTVGIPKALDQSVDELSAVVAAVTAGDPLRAQAAMTRHIASTEEAAREVLDLSLTGSNG